MLIIQTCFIGYSFVSLAKLVKHPEVLTLCGSTVVQGDEISDGTSERWMKKDAVAKKYEQLPLPVAMLRIVARGLLYDLADDAGLGEWDDYDDSEDDDEIYFKEMADGKNSDIKIA